MPVTRSDLPTLVHNYEHEGLNVYLKDISFDPEGRPVILYITSKGYESGPKNDPRTWTIARWNGKTWTTHPVTTSDNNYDMGSLYLDDVWRIIGPTEAGPQRFNPGGEMAMWVSEDKGVSWKRSARLTTKSPRNHTYARRPVHRHPDFYSFWADGHGRKPSASRLYFADRAGKVFVLPRKLVGEFASPIEVTSSSR